MKSLGPPGSNLPSQLATVENGTVSTPDIPKDLGPRSGGRIGKDARAVAVWKAPWRRQRCGEGEKGDLRHRAYSLGLAVPATKISKQQAAQLRDRHQPGTRSLSLQHFPRPPVCWPCAEPWRNPALSALQALPSAWASPGVGGGGVSEWPSGESQGQAQGVRERPWEEVASEVGP